MKKVKDIVRRLMPDGSDPRRAMKNPPQWTKCPWWPPDVFAVAATLVQQSGCYAQQRFSASCSPGYAFGPAYVNFVQTVASQWHQNIRAPAEAQKRWIEVVGSKWHHKVRAPAEAQKLWTDVVGKYGDADILDPAWQKAAMYLMAIADEASFGVGFSSGDTPFADFVLVEHLRAIASRKGGKHAFGKAVLPDISTSLCEMVPISEACVQPKSITPHVGCSLRSLSHNLALLPSNGVAATSWTIATDNKSLENDALNVLLIPFPFLIDGSCFVRQEETLTKCVDGTKHLFYGLKQRWMTLRGKTITARELANRLVLPMMQRAREEVGTINAVVFPETALPQSVADKLAKILEREAGLEFFIAGTLHEEKRSLAKNQVAAYFYGEVASGARRLLHTPVPPLSKCHRWCLDQLQVRRYHLGHALQPQGCYWWERIDIAHRACRFNEFRSGAVLAAMVCEDLARFEPIHPIVRSVGPNLVIVLLMDGPQLKVRWPGHYAGVLADDPGSGVLTLTSIGMARRSVPPGSSEPREIALWKQPGGEAQELRLPTAHQGLILTLSVHQVEQTTLDGRSDERTTRRFELSGVRPVKLAEKQMGRLAPILN